MWVMGYGLSKRTVPNGILRFACQRETGGLKLSHLGDIWVLKDRTVSSRILPSDLAVTNMGEILVDGRFFRKVKYDLMDMSKRTGRFGNLSIDSIV